jgi:hypothetical protein
LTQLPRQRVLPPTVAENQNFHREKIKGRGRDEWLSNRRGNRKACLHTTRGKSGAYFLQICDNSAGRLP